MGEEWVFKRDENTRKPIERLGLVSDSGIPYLRPEVVLLFKAKSNRDKDQRDFEQVIPRLDINSRGWLSNSLQTVHPNHPWLTIM